MVDIEKEEIMDEKLFVQVYEPVTWASTDY